MAPMHKTLLIAAACAAALGSAKFASAETSPYYLGGGLNVNQVSNIYRQNNNSNDDTVATASLLAGIDQTFGRQRLYGDVSLQNNRYRRNTDLNNQSYSVKAALDWATLERLSGTISGSKTRALAPYNVGNGVNPIFEKNVEDNTTINAAARIGLVTRLSIEATATYRSRDFSAVEYSSLVFNQNNYSLGLVYQPSDKLRLGVAGRRTNGKFPRYSLIGNGVYAGYEFTRNDLDLTGRWIISGASAIDGRLSYGKSTHSNGVGKDFSGGSGQISWSWQATAKLGFNTSVSRDTGLETSFFSFAGGSLSSDLNRITTALQINANYDLTSKVSLNAGVSLSKSDRKSAFLTQTADDYDRDKAFNLGARWQYSRSVLLGCQASHQSRDSSTAQYVFAANSYGCYGQFTIR